MPEAKQCGSLMIHAGHNWQEQSPMPYGHRSLWYCKGLVNGLRQRQCHRSPACTKKDHHQGGCYKPKASKEKIPLVQAQAVIQHLKDKQMKVFIASAIRPHVPNEFGWCGTCHRKVEPATHIAEILHARLSD